MKENKIIGQFIRFEPLQPWDKAVLVLYSILTVIVFAVCYIFKVFDRTDFVVIYLIATQLSLYLFLYIPLRNFRFFLFLMLFCVIHLFFYPVLIPNANFQSHQRTNPWLLLITPALLIIIQLLRLLNLLLQGYDLELPTRFGLNSFDNRVSSPTDIICFLIYMFTWFMLVSSVINL